VFNLLSLWVAAAVFFQGLLVLLLLAYLGTIRVPLIVNGKVRIADVALSREPWPTREKQASNAVDNQFQLPVLFYAACGFAIAMQAGWPDLILAWAFVVSRYVHAFIFITDNHVVRRFTAYSIGYIILCLFWAWIGFRLLAVGIAFGLH
jgi:hypothetical protein